MSDDIKHESRSIFQSWWQDLPMQQQSVLILPLRGPDGMGKYHPVKKIVKFYRATVLNSAVHGRALKDGECENYTNLKTLENTEFWIDYLKKFGESDTRTSFMNLEGFSSIGFWIDCLKVFFDYVDEIPHHYYLHLMHGAEIIGYKHPDQIFKTKWQYFYFRCCKDLHLNSETEVQMDERLSDWHQRYWD